MKKGDELSLLFISLIIRELDYKACLEKVKIELC